jgi:hypothetical protein
MRCRQARRLLVTGTGVCMRAPGIAHGIDRRAVRASSFARAPDLPVDTTMAR